MNQKLYKIEAFCDSETQVWVAESEDVPGLATEAYTIQSLTDKLREMIPELLHLNNIVPVDYIGNITFELISHRV
jgi:predicted RNase H-like HicB family nuclease